MVIMRYSELIHVCNVVFYYSYRKRFCLLVNPSRNLYTCIVTHCQSILNIKACLSSVIVLCLCLVFFLSVSVCNSGFKFSYFETLSLKYVKSFFGCLLWVIQKSMLTTLRNANESDQTSQPSG